MHRGRDFLILLGVLAGIALACWLVIAWLDYDKESSCAALGRRNCVPRIYTTGPGER
jgi:hypothetical protein